MRALTSCRDVTAVSTEPIRIDIELHAPRRGVYETGDTIEASVETPLGQATIRARVAYPVDAFDRKGRAELHVDVLTAALPEGHGYSLELSAVLEAVARAHFEAHPSDEPHRDESDWGGPPDGGDPRPLIRVVK